MKGVSFRFPPSRQNWEESEVANKLLNDARQNKKDEFYTQLSDIENELRHYKEHFRGKTVLCNCDDPRVSMFFHYFAYQFEALGLKRLITTCYKNPKPDEGDIPRDACPDEKGAVGTPLQQVRRGAAGPEGT